MTVNDKDFATTADGEHYVEQLLAKGRKARVQYPDGALWLYTPDGHCYKLNDM